MTDGSTFLSPAGGLDAGEPQPNRVLGNSQGKFFDASAGVGPRV